MGLYTTYYLAMESIWGRTLGKFVTGTRVISMNGRHPSFLQVLGRTLVRLIPGEPLSILCLKPGHGWHDYIPKTRVVTRRDYTPAKISEWNNQGSRPTSTSVDPY
jgi:uncharacterized RDD family membrane protein YckC